jgi:glutamine synthetase
MHDQLGKLTLHQLRVFRAVARERNFTKAAAQMGLTQSAVSVQVRDLGAILGAPLFDVLGKKVHLTDAGRLLEEHAARAEGLMRELSQDFSVLRDVGAGSVRIGASTSVGIYYLPALLAEFSTKHPRVAVSLVIENTARIEEPNLGYKPSFKGGYFPVSPTDTYHDLRGEMVNELRKIGIVVEAHHHEVATAGQSEIDMKFAPLLKMGDQFMWFKYIIKNVARRHGKTVTFMPKPIFEDNGSGMHTHMSLWKDGKPLFAGKGYAGLSETALHAVGGILQHAPAILAFAAPTTNSYRRLVPGFEAPVNLAMSARNRSAAVRIPMYSTSPKAKRLEFRCPDPSCNGYLSFSAVLMAAIDGIQNRIDPGPPLDRDIYEMTPEELRGTPKTPGQLQEALDALEKDHEFLLRGGVFTDDLIHTWIAYKRQNEVDPLRLRPHPFEFFLYYDN